MMGAAPDGMAKSAETEIRRVKAYEEAGVDMLFLAGMRTRAELDAISAAVKLPRSGLPQRRPAAPEAAASGMIHAVQPKLEGVVPWIMKSVWC